MAETFFISLPLSVEELERPQCHVHPPKSYYKWLFPLILDLLMIKFSRDPSVLLMKTLVTVCSKIYVIWMQVPMNYICKCILNTKTRFQPQRHHGTGEALNFFLGGLFLMMCVCACSGSYGEDTWGGLQPLDALELALDSHERPKCCGGNSGPLQKQHRLVRTEPSPQPQNLTFLRQTNGFKPWFFFIPNYKFEQGT